MLFHAMLLPCNVVFGLYVQNTIVQTEIRNFGWKNRVIWGGRREEIFPLTDLEIKSIFLIIVFALSLPSKPNNKTSNLLRSKMRRWGYQKMVM